MLYLCEYLQSKNNNNIYLIDLSCSVFYDEYEDIIIGDSNMRLLRLMIRDMNY